MVTMPVLFDSCVLSDYLNAVPQARVACDREPDRAISVITWMEVLIGTDESTEDEVRKFLLNFRILPLTTAIAERSVALRKTIGVKLPDAIIKATGEGHGRPLVSRNTRDFRAGTTGTNVPYTL